MLLLDTATLARRTNYDENVEIIAGIKRMKFFVLRYLYSIQFNSIALFQTQEYNMHTSST